MPAPSPRREALRACASAARHVIATMAETTADTASLARAADHLAAAAALLARDEGQPPANDRTELGKEHGPMFGLSRPMAPPMDLYVEGETVVGEVTFGVAFEGPPGHVYGGSIASAFDDVLGVAPQTDDEVAVTVGLTVRYVRRTPIGEPLRFEGRITSIEGRKVIATGECRHDGEVTAIGEGTFIRVPKSRMGSGA